MGRLRRLIGIALLAAVATIGVPTVLADGPQESPGITGPQESPGITGPQESPGIMGPQESPGLTINLITYMASTFTR
jgi:hypothetical protein